MCSASWQPPRHAAPIVCVGAPPPVPAAVKDCVDALPYPTTAGTAFMAGW